MDQIMNMTIGLVLLFVAVLVHEATHYAAARFYRLKRRFFVTDYNIGFDVEDITISQARIFLLLPLPITAIPLFLALVFMVNFELVWFPLCVCLALAFSCFMSLQDILAYRKEKRGF